MSRLLSTALATASLLALVALAVPAAAATKAMAGDFGPPQGAPIELKLVDPPGVPAPIHRDHPVRVIVRMETKELVKDIARWCALRLLDL